MHTGILGVPGVGISFLGVLRGAMSSCSFFFYFFTLRLSKFSTISSVMALSSDSTSANRPWVHLEYLLIVLPIIYVLVTIL